eukprot:SAG31_NODE_3670_length_4002_cov_17.262875_2_plen_36_part_00
MGDFLGQRLGTPAQVEDGTLIEWNGASITINGTRL